MLTILHGDDTATSRKYFFDQKQKHPDVVILEGEKITLTDLVQTFASDGLFTDSKTVFIEQILTKKKKSKELDEIIAALNKYASTHEIFLWEGKELEKSSLNSFKQAIPRVFKLPQTLFTFLDSIKPNNGKQLIILFHQTIETTEIEMVFFMFVRHIRMLLALKDAGEHPIDEVKRIAPWQKSKLEKQATYFTREQLIT